MPYLRLLLVGAVLMSSVVLGQPPANAPIEGPMTAVAYVEARAAATDAARAALRRYARSHSRDGIARVEIFEQVGRPGHFALIETWRDQQAFAARDPAVQARLLEEFQPLRVSGYDERPYKTLTTAPGATATSPGSVYVISHVDVAPSAQSPPVPLLRRLAEASRQEAGNLRFDVWQHTQRANHFTVVEHWRSQEALDAHVATAHARQYRDELQPMTGSPLDERAYTAVE